MHADDQVAGAPAEMTAVDGVEGETPPEEVVGAAEAPGPAVDVDEGMGGPAENEWDGHASDCSTHNEPANANGPCDCAASSDEMPRWMKYRIANGLPIEDAPDRGGCVMDFGKALDALKVGARVAREGWNGRGMFAYLVPANSYPVQTGAAASHFGAGAMIPYRAYLALKTVDEDVATWAPSCSDVLADDWVLA